MMLRLDFLGGHSQRTVLQELEKQIIVAARQANTNSCLGCVPARVEQEQSLWFAPSCSVDRK